MKTNRFVLLLFLLGYLAYAQEQDKVLFIGNSYTFIEDIPNMFYLVASSAGDDLFVDSQTAGSATFENHANNTDVTNEINSQNWDFVVLQGQSIEVALTGTYFDTNVAPFASQLVQTIEANDDCTQSVFYRTWGREFGLTGSICDNYPWTCTYEGMDDELAQNYRVLADVNDAVISPVGQVWRYLIETAPIIPNLFHDDQSHQSVIGAYAAACTFYTVLTRKDPTLITYEATLTAYDAALIKEAVKTVVYDQLSLWKIDEFDLSADFNEVVSGNQVTFTNTSMNSRTTSWDFGDGTTSTEENPIHFYTETGDFTAILTVTKCGENDMFSKTISINTLETEDSSLSKVKFYPNPTRSVMHFSGIDTNEIETLELYTLLGENIKMIRPKTNTIDLFDLSAGMYFCKIRTKEGQVLLRRFIKD